MAINIVSVQHNGGFLPGIILFVDPCNVLLRSGNPFKCHEEVLYLQRMIPPKRFDIFLPNLEAFGAVPRKGKGRKWVAIGVVARMDGIG